MKEKVVHSRSVWLRGSVLEALLQTMWFQVIVWLPLKNHGCLNGIGSDMAKSIVWLYIWINLVSYFGTNKSVYLTAYVPGSVGECGPCHIQDLGADILLFYDHGERVAMKKTHHLHNFAISIPSAPLQVQWENKIMEFWNFGLYAHTHTHTHTPMLDTIMWYFFWGRSLEGQVYYALSRDMSRSGKSDTAF